MRYTILAIILAACGPSGEYPEDANLWDASETNPVDGDGDTDTDTDVDSDTDVDVDSDSDTDSDADGDSDSEEQDAGEDAAPEADVDLGPPPCPDHETMCGRECIDLATDINNCGSCGRVCDEGRFPICSGGECHAYTSCVLYGRPCSLRCVEELGAADCSDQCLAAYPIPDRPQRLWLRYESGIGWEDEETGWEWCANVSTVGVGRTALCEYPGGFPSGQEVVSTCCCNLR